MVGRPGKFSPTNQEYWEKQYDGEEDVADAAADGAALVASMDSEYRDELFGDSYGSEGLEDAPEAAWEVFSAIFGQDADSILEGEGSGDDMSLPDNMAEASRSGEYGAETYDPMEDQSTNAITRR